MSTSFELSPWLPQAYYLMLGALAGAVLLLAFARRMPDFAWRAGALALVAFLLLNPIILNEVRQGLRDKLVIVVDDSASQRIGGRDKVAEVALQNLTDKLNRLKNIDPVVIRSGQAGDGKGESTNLFSVLRNSLMSIPLPQVAGTVFITDGQVHDVPAELGALERLAPFHVLLTGKKDEFDRKVTVVSAPKYGVLNETVVVSVRVEEPGGRSAGALPLSVYQDGRKREEITVPVGELRQFTFEVEHPGQNVYEFSVPEAEGELTAANNRAPVIVNGIRDRLRVLLVSGSPHMGERAWRNLLKSDPSIDLIHFTILRSPENMSVVPSHQLALIEFPHQQLFEQKINDFDLIIFDRFQDYGVLMMPAYFENIARFVRRGGAFLMAAGTADPAQAASSPALDSIMPLELSRRPDGILKQTYVPALTALGKSHPVTADLQKQYDKRPWGSWFAQVETGRAAGDTLMTGIDGRPLLVLDTAGEGRIAVLSSDNIWLWSKGLSQSGPYTDLLRNVAHWLMKEPELENDFIKAEAKGMVITVAQRDLGGEPPVVAMTDPSGAQRQVTLNNRIPGWITAEVEAATTGIYSFDNGRKKAFAVVGAARNEEFAEVRTTAERLQPVVQATGGGIIWFQENQDYPLKEVKPSARKMGDEEWLGIKRNQAYTVDNVETRSLVPNWLVLLTILSVAILAWWRESGPR